MIRYLAIALIITLSGAAIAQSPILRENTPVEVFQGKQRDKGDGSLDKESRTLRIDLTVSDQNHLKVKKDDEVKKGTVIVDNTDERERLDRQKKSILLQIQNLKSKPITEPIKPPVPPPARDLPPAIFSEEEAAIAQAQMKLNQARAILEGRTPLLQSDNPQIRAETEKVEAELQVATQKVQEQEQLIAGMRDMKMQPQIIQHEEAKLRQIQSEYEQARSALDQSKAKLNASAIEQQQQLQQLQLAVKMAESDLSVAQSRLTAAQSRRKLLEYDASIDATKRSLSENQTALEYSRQLQQHAQAIRDRDYQLAQFNINLTAVEDKLAQIPIIRSPRDGYIKRVKPWVGRNGQYTTTITITSNPVSSKNGDSNRSESPQTNTPTNAPRTTPNTTTNKPTR